MASDGGSYSGSRPWRQRTIVQQTFPTHSASEGSVAASLTVGCTTSVVEGMIQLSTPSLDSESGSTPISAEEAFVSIMGKD
ncbi:hypothetical protein Taro_032996 [Colocasia esculenta]|uniref:Uncharacterized protein n=1 Tax=Colocasia esculenta TaxID=4460 RepID=A0A843W7R6_COLES|nr:hypothetical protein [Colocasia esculenta]